MLLRPEWGRTQDAEGVTWGRVHVDALAVQPNEHSQASKAVAQFAHHDLRAAGTYRFQVACRDHLTSKNF